MTWREQLVARILLIIARMVAGDATLQNDIKHLSNSIYVNGSAYRDDADINGAAVGSTRHSGVALT